MRLALSVWNGRISPVFDVSRRVLLAEVYRGNVVKRNSRSLDEDEPYRKAVQLAEWRVEMLICGAVSQGLVRVLRAYGIQLIPFTSGDVEEVIRAYLSGALDNPQFSMPGCCGRGGRRHRGRHGVRGI